jgi:hypothetical protein
MLKMKQRPRIDYSAEQKALMWDRWQAGDSLHEIARLFDRGHSLIQGILAETGGPPVSYEYDPGNPAPRKQVNGERVADFSTTLPSSTS